MDLFYPLMKNSFLVMIEIILMENLFSLSFLALIGIYYVGFSCAFFLCRGGGVSLLGLEWLGWFST